MRSAVLIAAVCLALAALGYTLTRRPETQAKDPSVIPATQTATDVVNDEAFHLLLLHVAADYQRFGRVDDAPRFAPTMCAAPPDFDDLPTIRFSRAGGDSPHDRKLYYLFARNRSSYRALPKSVPVGQAIVKQSWQPVELKSDADADPASDVAAHPDDGKLYRAGKQSSLFIMVKTAPGTPGTDEGWVYGTVTADGNRVTSAGRVESCMNCHVSGTRDRLFGLQAADGSQR